MITGICDAFAYVPAIPVFAIDTRDVPLETIRLPVVNEAAPVPPSVSAITSVKPEIEPPTRFATKFAITNVGSAMLIVLKS